MRYTFYSANRRVVESFETYGLLRSWVHDNIGAGVYRFKGRRALGGFWLIGTSKLSGTEYKLGFVEVEY